MLTGRGGDGKSELINLIRELFPAGSAVSVNPHDMGEQYYRANLVGVRLNAVAELPEKELLDGSTLKAVITGDQISARQIREEPVYFCPLAGHIFSCNLLPPTSDTTKGFRRRWMILGFNRSITAAEKIVGLAKIILETEVPGIVAWAIAGYQRLCLQGAYTPVPSSEEALNEWLQHSDSVAQWVAEYTTVLDATDMSQKAKAGWSKARAAYQAYSEWAKSANHRLVSETKFGEKIKSILNVTAADCKRANGTYLPIELHTHEMISESV